MKAHPHIRHCLRLLIAAGGLVTAASLVAQPAGRPGGGGRGAISTPG